MKYIVISYIAFGLVLSAVIGLEYSCDRGEYTGSPFVFRQKDLGSSLTYYYSVFGLIVNTAIWVIILLLLRHWFLKFITRVGNGRRVNILYNVVVGLLILFSTMNVAINYFMLGNRFDKRFNYWYFDVDKEADNPGVNCTGKWGTFLFPE